MPIAHFFGGSESAREKLNEIVDVVNRMDGLIGDEQFIAVIGGRVKLNIDNVLARIPKLYGANDSTSIVTQTVMTGLQVSGTSGTVSTLDITGPIATSNFAQFNVTFSGGGTGGGASNLFILASESGLLSNTAINTSTGFNYESPVFGGSITLGSKVTIDADGGYNAASTPANTEPDDPSLVATIAVSFGPGNTSWAACVFAVPGSGVWSLHATLVNGSAGWEAQGSVIFGDGSFDDQLYTKVVGGYYGYKMLATTLNASNVLVLGGTLSLSIMDWATWWANYGGGTVMTYQASRGGPSTGGGTNQVIVSGTSANNARGTLTIAAVTAELIVA